MVAWARYVQIVPGNHADERWSKEAQKGDSPSCKIKKGRLKRHTTIKQLSKTSF